MKTPYEIAPKLERYLPTGLIARIATQCIDPVTGKTGSFLFTGDSHKEEDSRVSPLFGNLSDLFIWAKLEWVSVGYNLET
jgi:hypothetical protein